MIRPRNDFINFPLCLLSYPCDDFRERLDYISSYVVCFARRDEYAKEELETMCFEKYPEDFESDDNWHCNIVLTARKYGFEIDSVQLSICRFKDIWNYFKDFENKYGKDAYVRVPFKFFKNASKSFKQYEIFSVLCAIKAVLGKNKKSKFKRITIDRIIAAVNGYKSPKLFLKAIDEGQKGLNRISRYKINNIVDNLCDLGQISKYTFKHRQTYYSSYLSFDNLLKAVLKSKEYQKNIRRKRREKEKVYDRMYDQMVSKWHPTEPNPNLKIVNNSNLN